MSSRRNIYKLIMVESNKKPRIMKGKVDGGKVEEETTNDTLRFDLNVGGVEFIIDDKFVNAFESERLNNLLEDEIQSDGIYEIDADPACFSSFLHLIRFGSLPQYKGNEEEMELLSQAEFWGVRPMIEKNLAFSRSQKSNANIMKESGGGIPCPRSFDYHHPCQNVCHYYSTPFLEFFQPFDPYFVRYQGQNKCICGNNNCHCRSCPKKFYNSNCDCNQRHKHGCDCHLQGHGCRSISKCNCVGSQEEGCNQKITSRCYKIHHKKNFVDNRSNGLDAQKHHVCCPKFADSSFHENGYHLPYCDDDRNVESSFHYEQECANSSCRSHCCN